LKTGVLCSAVSSSTAVRNIGAALAKHAYATTLATPLLLETVLEKVAVKAVALDGCARGSELLRMHA
jgi:hypothetical protein